MSFSIEFLSYESETIRHRIQQTYVKWQSKKRENLKQKMYWEVKGDNFFVDIKGLEYFNLNFLQGMEF